MKKKIKIRKPRPFIIFKDTLFKNQVTLNSNGNICVDRSDVGFSMSGFEMKKLHKWLGQAIAYLESKTPKEG